MLDWIIWGVLLVLQNAASCASSRAKNSQSLWYNGTVSVFSNGIWFASQYFIVDKLIAVKSDHTLFHGSDYILHRFDGAWHCDGSEIFH